jgi:hypothetical protein
LLNNADRGIQMDLDFMKNNSLLALKLGTTSIPYEQNGQDYLISYNLQENTALLESFDLENQTVQTHAFIENLDQELRERHLTITEFENMEIHPMFHLLYEMGEEFKERYANTYQEVFQLRHLVYMN